MLRAWPALLLAAPAMQPPHDAIAQTRTGLVSFQRITIPDDNPAHLPTAMVQDRRGLPWTGTQAGLVRYQARGARRAGHPELLQRLADTALYAARRSRRDGLRWT